MKYELINEIKYSSPLTQIFINRGFKEEDIDRYINISEKELLNPNLLDNIVEGAKLIVSHLLNGSKIFVVVDSDADGYTSASVLINYLLGMCPSAVNRISYGLHDGKEHGIILDKIPEDIQLVITPDSASNNIEEHRILRERGVDVLVLDHHECDEVSPYACIINNQTCDYPNKSLSGVGIVYKLCCLIDAACGTDDASNYLDMVALGIISDMMVVTNFENRYIIKQGLEQVKNPFFKAMCKKNEFKLGDKYNPLGISFYVTPYINAMVRSGTQEQKELMFKAMLNHEAEQMIPSTKRGCKGEFETVVEQAVRTCANVKKHQDDAKKEQVTIIEKIIQENNLNENKILIIPLTEYIDKNLVGLIANQLMSKYQKPVILLNKYEDENGVRWSGSARSVNRSVIENLRGFVADSGYAQFAEGHGAAFGTSFTENGLSEFTEYSNNELKHMDFSPIYKVDFIFDGATLNHSPLLEICDNLSPYWGQNFEESMIAIEKIKITRDNIELMAREKNPTLKIILPSGVELIKFGSSEEEYERLLPKPNQATYITAVGRCGKNEWMGRIKAQVSLEEYEINEIQYDF